MNNAAFITAALTMGVVTLFTVYFFVLVLKTPDKPEQDSYTDNDPESDTSH